MTVTLKTFFKYTRIAEVDANLLNLKQSKIAERDDVSASIGYYTEKWALAAFGKNLTDERYEVFLPDRDTVCGRFRGTGHEPWAWN